MNIMKMWNLNFIKELFVIVILNIILLSKVYAEKFVVTGHVYANINEFEYILNDDGLHDSVKSLLSHLHTPLLKLALLD